MSEIFGLDVSNFDKLRLKTGLLHESIRKNLQDELFRQGTIVERRAKEILRTIHWQTRGGITRGRSAKRSKRYEPGATVVGHIDTGALQRSIHTEATANRNLLQVRIGTDNTAPYGIYVELLPDGGFLRPAFRANIRLIELRLGAKIKEVIAFVAKKKL